MRADIVDDFRDRFHNVVHIPLFRHELLNVGNSMGIPKLKKGLVRFAQPQSTMLS